MNGGNKIHTYESYMYTYYYYSSYIYTYMCILSLLIIIHIHMILLLRFLLQCHTCIHIITTHHTYTHICVYYHYNSSYTCTYNHTGSTVATKFTPTPWRRSAQDVVKAAEQSAARLGVQQLDLYQVNVECVLYRMCSL